MLFTFKYSQQNVSLNQEKMSVFTVESKVVIYTHKRYDFNVIEVFS